MSIVRTRIPPFLTREQFVFAQEYLRNGFNASAAYAHGHPKAKRSTCAVEGHRTLRKPHVAHYISRRLASIWRARVADGDEVLGRVIGDATSDVTLLFDAHGQILPPQDWPPAIVNSIEAVELRDGGYKVKLVPKGPARRTVLEVTGKVKSTAGSIDELAAALRGDLEKHGGA